MFNPNGSFEVVNSTVLLMFNFSVMEEIKVVKKRVRDESEGTESDIDSPEDLDSFMRSFEEEITASPSAAGGGEAEVVDLTSDSGDSQPDLGYLLGASDDELGIPPPMSSPGGLETELRTEPVRVESARLNSEASFGRFRVMIRLDMGSGRRITITVNTWRWTVCLTIRIWVSGRVNMNGDPKRCRLNRVDFLVFPTYVILLGLGKEYC
ncbi:hypothetical protein DH2020_011943 [Rehmannia glutinosa]|uniref:Uncharacterized protein n=1 Tax=Rehmannia glutinosa TaxID=99300 RepID=A0ABR0XEQ7_REHGL